MPMPDVPEPRLSVSVIRRFAFEAAMRSTGGYPITTTLKMRFYSAKR